MNRSHPGQLATTATVGLLLLAVTPTPALPESVDSPGAIVEWWDATGPGAAMAVVRLLAMAGLTYVAAIAALYTIADVLRLAWLRRLALLAASPGLRRHLSAGALTLAIAAMPATAHGQSATSEPTIVLADVGPGASDQPTEAGREPIVLIDAGPAVVEPPAPTDRHVTPPGPHVAGFGRYEVAETPDAWVVEAGDHLWAIAVRALENAAQPTDNATVTSYWARLISANSAELDGDPDVIHIGQVITLPPVVQG